MKTILCFGDSNVWGGIPGVFNPETGLAGRYTKDKSWAGVLQKILGHDFNVIIDGINGRTTAIDEIFPGRPYKNGLKLLPISLEMHYPINLVIFWIGTNDTKIQFNRSIEDIKEGARSLIQCVKSSNKGLDGSSPKIMLISPQPIIKVANLHPQLDDTSIEKSKKISACYQSLAKEEKCEFLDAGLYIQSSTIDGVHLGENDCEKIGKEIAKKIKLIDLM